MTRLWFSEMFDLIWYDFLVEKQALSSDKKAMYPCAQKLTERS